MKNKFTYPLIVLCCVLMVSCEVEFSPNAEWQEVPVVYCMLDQDEDTTWVRVERCYLSEGDIYSPSMVNDSINYPAGALQVKMYAMLNGTDVDSFDFEYVLRDRDSGDFVSQAQPLYASRTRRSLRDECTYRLEVRRTADGSMLASAETPLVIRPEGSVITKVNDNGKFGFYFNNACRIDWKAMTNARLYQPIIRFYYTIGTDTLYVDTPCALVHSRNNALSYTTSYSCSAFLEALKRALQDDPRPKGYPKVADIYITACSEDLNAYITSVNAGGNLDQGRELYSNINGGLGIFASRRTHIYKRVECDPSDNPTSAHTGLNALLRELGVGFE